MGECPILLTLTLQDFSEARKIENFHLLEGFVIFGHQVAHLHLVVYNEDCLLLRVLLNDLVVWLKEDDCRLFELEDLDN